MRVVRVWMFADCECSGRSYFALYGVGVARWVEMADERRGVLYGALAGFRRLRDRAF